MLNTIYIAKRKEVETMETTAINTSYTGYDVGAKQKDSAEIKQITSDKKQSKTYASARDYKKYLSEKYDCLRSKDYSVAIDSSLLNKAMSDDKTREWLEYNLSLEPACYEKTKASVKSRGWELLSYSTTFNADGSITTETCSRSEVDPETEKKRKELEERLEKKREERKVEEKKREKETAAERMEEKKEQYTLTIEGKNVEEVTGKLIDAISAIQIGITVPNGFSSFDVKA